MARPHMRWHQRPAVGIVTSAPSTYDAAVQSLSALVLFAPLGDAAGTVAVDLSPAPANGTVPASGVTFGVTDTLAGPGVESGAMSLAAGCTGVTFPHQSAFNLSIGPGTSWLVMLDYRVDPGAPGFPVVMSKGDRNAGGWDIFAASDGTVGFIINGQQSAAQTGVLPTTMASVAVAWDGTNLTVLVNGVQRWQAQPTAQTATSTAPLTIGATSDSRGGVTVAKAVVCAQANLAQVPGVYRALTGGVIPGVPVMPAVAPAGYTRAFGENFDTPAAPGSFDTVYGAKFGEYANGTSTNGFTQYDPVRVLYAQNGSMFYNLHSEGGVSYCAAPQPGPYLGFTYGQWGCCVRLVSSNGDGYKIAFLMWPTSGAWTNEVDFPEVDPDFTAPIRAVSLVTTTPSGPHNFDGTLNTGASFADNLYHTFLLDWPSPTVMNAYLDGVLVQSFPAESIPSQPMRVSLQAEGWINQGAVPASTTTVVEVPWVYINTKP